MATPLSTDYRIGQIKRLAFLLLTAAQNGNSFLVVLKRRYICNKKIKPRRFTLKQSRLRCNLFANSSIGRPFKTAYQ